MHASRGHHRCGKSAKECVCRHARTVMGAQSAGIGTWCHGVMDFPSVLSFLPSFLPFFPAMTPGDGFLLFELGPTNVIDVFCNTEFLYTFELHNIGERELLHSGILLIRSSVHPFIQT
jgi:hypothetical protein